MNVPKTKHEASPWKDAAVHDGKRFQRLGMAAVE
jgi:hypothetical protein